MWPWRSPLPPWGLTLCSPRSKSLVCSPSLPFCLLPTSVPTPNMYAKSLQLCQTLCNPMDWSPPGSSVQGFSPGKNTGVGCHALLQGILLTQGSNPSLITFPALTGGFFITTTIWEAHHLHRYHAFFSPSSADVGLAGHRCS